ncbi:hypothetical protein Tco_1314322 [Tanacetum coccineum]
MKISTIPTTGPVRTKNMLTGKWTRMHGDCQRFNAFYKQANRKSGKNEADLIENVKTVYLKRVGKKFQYPHVWKILKEYPKRDAAEPIDGDNLQEVKDYAMRNKAKQQTELEAWNSKVREVRDFASSAQNFRDLKSLAGRLEPSAMDTNAIAFGL